MDLGCKCSENGGENSKNRLLGWLFTVLPSCDPTDRLASHFGSLPSCRTMLLRCKSCCPFLSDRNNAALAVFNQPLPHNTAIAVDVVDPRDRALTGLGWSILLRRLSAVVAFGRNPPPRSRLGQGRAPKIGTVSATTVARRVRIADS